MAEREIDLPQRVPLLRSECSVDRCGRVHPRIDDVFDGEEGRRRHHIAARTGGAAVGVDYGGCFGVRVVLASVVASVVASVNVMIKRYGVAVTQTIE